MDIRFVQRFPSVEEGRLPKSIYVEGTPGDILLTFYITGENPELFKKSVDEGYIDERLNALGASGGVKYVTNIAERNILTLVEDTLVVVEDASDDPLLESTSSFTAKDGMIYMYLKDNASFKAIARLSTNPYAENQPHIHNNKETLDKIGSSEVLAADGIVVQTLTVNGRIIPSVLVDNPVW